MPTESWFGISNSFQQQTGHNAKGVMNFEQVNVTPMNVGFSKRFECRLPRRKQIERIITLFQAKPIRGNART